MFDELVNELFSNDNYNDDNNVGENNDSMNQGINLNDIIDNEQYTYII